MSQSINNPTWDEAYAEPASRYLDQYFGGPGGLTSAFPSMRNDYLWAAGRPAIPDSRVTAKNNTEYHGLESQAGQYHAAAMYAEASHHWLMAAWWRHIDKTTHGFGDAGHDRALSFCVKNFRYNEALEAWSTCGGAGAAARPVEFGLTDGLADRIQSEGQQVLDDTFRAQSARQSDDS